MKQKENVTLVKIKRHKGPLLLPETLSFKDAIKVLKVQERLDEELVDVSKTFDFFVWDGAIAFLKALEQMFGYVHGITTNTFFSQERPRIIKIDTSLNQQISVPWGTFTVPGFSVDEVLETSSCRKNGILCFQLGGTIQRRHEAAFEELCSLIQKILEKQSIYKGHPFRISFKAKDGTEKTLPEPKFINLEKVNPEELIFSVDVDAAIQTNIFVPIKKTDACRKNNVPLKRGVLLSGDYGTGKTLTAYVTAKICEQYGWTFIYCESVDDLEDVIMFSRRYEPVVIFCEDIDRRVGGTRNRNIDSVLNIVDGLLTKESEILTILTTNHIENIHEALLRPGRLDAVINISRPDQVATEKLIRLYSRGLIEEDEDISETVELLTGSIPAFIREAVERSKLVCIGKSTSENIKITKNHLKIAALGMQSHLSLMKGGVEPTKSDNLSSVMKEVIKEALDATDGQSIEK